MHMITSGTFNKATGMYGIVHEDCDLNIQQNELANFCVKLRN